MGGHTHKDDRKWYGWLNGEKMVQLADWGPTYKGDRKKGMAEWGSHTHKSDMIESGMTG